MTDHDRLSLIRTLFQKGDYRQAQDALERLIAAEPDMMEAKHLLALAHIEQGQGGKAVVLLQDMLKADIGVEGPSASPSESAETHYLLSRALTGVGQFHEALTASREALLRAPTDARFHFQIGLLLLRSTPPNVQLAITSLQTATQIAPHFVPAYRLLCRVLIDAGKPAEAIAGLQRGVKALPDNVDLFTDLSRLLHETNHLEAAIPCYRTLIRLNPDDCQNYINLADVLHACSRHDEADDVLLNALERWPRNPTFTSTTVHSCLRRPSIDGGVAALQRAISRNISLMDDACYILWRSSYYQWAEQFSAAHLHVLEKTESRKPPGLYSFKQVFYPRHIGEIALASDLFFKMHKLGWLPQIERIGLVAKAGQIANQYLVDLLKENFPQLDILPDDEQGRKYRLYDGNIVRLPDGRIRRREDAMCLAQEQWENEGRGPLLAFPKADRERGETLLRALGIGPDDWYVCVHVRDSSYNQSRGIAEEGNQFRNSALAAHMLAIEHILSLGGKVVRLGREGAPLPKQTGVIDYPHSGMIEDFLDIYLVARCRFFIGNASGITGVANLFTRPVAMTNALPMAAGPFSRHDLVIHKFLRDRSSGNILSVAELARRKACNFYFQHEYDEAGLEAVENSPEDILGLVRDMLNQIVLIEAGQPIPALNEAQMLWRSSFDPDATIPGCRIAPSFIERHKDTLLHN